MISLIDHVFSRFFFFKICASRYCSLQVPQLLKASPCQKMAPSELTHDKRQGDFNCCGLTTWMNQISFVSFQSLLFPKRFPTNLPIATILDGLSQSICNPQKIEQKTGNKAILLFHFYFCLITIDLVHQMFLQFENGPCAVRHVAQSSAEARLRTRRVTLKPPLRRSTCPVPWLRLLGCRATEMHGVRFRFRRKCNQGI